jgi:hypothetical protein
MERAREEAVMAYPSICPERQKKHNILVGITSFSSKIQPSYLTKYK